MKKKNYLTIEDRKIGLDYAPFVIAEIGINHEGSLETALKW
jgi:N-acetylneuraminate synthase